MTATAIPARHHDNDDVVLVPFAKEHRESALRLSQEMSWPYRLEDWAFALELGEGFVLRNGAGTVIATAAWWGLRRDPSFMRDDPRLQGCPRPWLRGAADECAADSGAPANDHAELDGRRSDAL